MGTVKKATLIPSREIEPPELVRARSPSPADELDQDHYLNGCDERGRPLRGRYYFRAVDDDQAMELAEPQLREWLGRSLQG